jgi:ATPase subunit of ABC transporter with duplicated ATPase domains
MAAWSIRGARPKATLVPGNGPRRPKGMAIIEVDHIHKRYRDAVAVEDVSFAVERGEIFAILGPNGAGKTTAVEIVEGLRVPDRGTCRGTRCRRSYGVSATSLRSAPACRPCRTPPAAPGRNRCTWR